MGRELVVAGIGASAGGLSALSRLVSALPHDSGLAFIVLQHQAESQAGKLATILGPLAPIGVVDVREGVSIAANHVYIVPPHTRATLVNGSLALEPTGAASPHKPIDELFSSLAERLGARAIGVVLSGTGDDGTAGLRAIRAAGGVTAVQDPETAEHAEMPRSAIAAGVVDVVLPVERLAADIAGLRRGSAPAISRILDQLRQLTGIDFTTYKRATVERRLERQLGRHHLATLDDYAAYLAQHPSEARLLYEDLLVHVTEFFRDPSVFELVRAHVIPELLAAKPKDAPLRVWVPGCSTGEEAYSIAILLLDVLAERNEPRTLQIFATDLSERAIEVARAGRYPKTIRGQVSEAQIARYFVPDGNGFRIASAVRERCVFVRHDLVTDPPFSRLDLVSCRNVLIYLGPALQRRVVPLFHYALEQPGFLLLGASESIAGYETMFTPVELGASLYRRKPASVRADLLFGTRTVAGTRRAEPVIPVPDLLREADHVLLARYAPACVLVDESFEVVQFRGRTGAYLEPAPGHPQLNVFAMLRDRLGSEVRSAMIRAQRDDISVRIEAVEFGDEPQTRRVDVEVIPVRAATAPRHYLIVFEERTPSLPAPVSAVRRGTGDRVEQLEQELVATREYLTTVIAQHVATSEELGVVNEELQSANEELQSTNEELLTAKEELQSSNDELESLNVELERGNSELRKTNDDLINVLASVDIAIIIVDRELHIRRFTPRARAQFRMIETDIGRPIADLKPSFPIVDLDATIAEVIDRLAVHEREVRDADGHWYRMHVRPYRTSEQQIGGAVISFVDITMLRESIEAGRRAREAERAAQEAITREKDAFLNAVSHELRTPLSAILLWTEVIRQIASSQPDVVRAVDTIAASARAEAQLVEDLLDLALSRTNSSAVLIAVQPLDPKPVIEDAVATLRPTADAKQVEVAVEVERDAHVLADPRRLRQIVWHLVTNAIKFTASSGRVRVGLARRDGAIELTVADTGKGVHAEFLRSVFEPFSQEDGSSTRVQPGLGIGLAFVRHLVERQAGTIAVTSSGEGQGAAFTVRLPAV